MKQLSGCKLSKLAFLTTFDNLFLYITDGKLHKPKRIHRITTGR
jgi:hypothetical protein